MRIICSLIAVVFLTMPGHQQVSAQSRGTLIRKVAKKDRKLAEKVKKTKPVLAGSVHKNPKTYYEHDDEQYYYEHSLLHRNIFRVSEDEQVSITSVKSRKDNIEVRFKSDRLGPGMVTFSSPLHSPVIDAGAFFKGYNLCFVTDESNAASALVGNTASRMLHARGCNHLPSEDRRVDFDSIETGQTAGYRICKLCFLSRPLVSDYGTERMMGLYASQEIRALGQLSTSDSLQAKANSIGERVLKNWPVPLQGYNYKFYVMEDAEFNAYALPTGFVYVNSGLLEIAESDLEIEGVIAHEISHVERRHRYRLYRRQKRNQGIATGIGILAGALAGVKSKNNKAANAYVVGRLAQMFSSAVTQVLQEGYPRSMEEEADAVAALYLEQHYGETGLLAMANAMKKLQYYSDYMGVQQKEAQAFRSHPLLDDRIATFTGSKVRIFEHPLIIRGQTREGEEAVTIKLTSQRWTSPAVAGRYTLDPTQVLGEFVATAELGSPRKFRDLTLITKAGKKLKLDNKEDSLIGPYEEEGFLLRGDVGESIDELE